MRTIIFVLLIVFCFSCSDSESTENVNIELKSDESKFQEKESDSIVDILVDATLPFEKKIPDLIEKLSLSFDTSSSSKSILPSRFGNEMNRSLCITRRSKPTEKANLFFYKYADTLSFQNVLSNWYGCFAENCVPIKEDENIKNANSSPSLTIINYDQMEFMHFNFTCEDNQHNWQNVIEQLKQIFISKKTKTIFVDCKSRLTWS